MNFVYSIANYNWHFVTDYPLVENEYSLKFKALGEKKTPDWICRAKKADKLPVPSGILIKTTKDQRIYLDGSQLWMELLSRESDEAWFLTKYSLEDAEESSLWILDDKRPYTARVEHLWSAVNFPAQLLKKDVLLLHAAVIEYRGKALMFLAPTCTGKSTQAQLWERLRGARQVNGDKAALRIENGVVRAYGLPFCGTSGICEVYDLPLEALVILSQAEENEICRVSGLNALLSVLNNCYGHREIPGCGEKIFRLLEPVIAKVPVYALACTPDERAVELLENCLREE